MDPHRQKAFILRQRAEELRAMIPDMKDPQSVKTLEKIVEDYDRLAEMQERLAESGGYSG